MAADLILLTLLAFKEIRRVLRHDGFKSKFSKKSRCSGNQINCVAASCQYLLFHLIHQHFAESSLAQRRIDRNPVDDIAAFPQRQHTARDQSIPAVRMRVLNMSQILLHCLADLPAFDNIRINLFITVKFQTVFYKKLYQTLIFVRGTHHKFHWLSPFFLFRIAQFGS